MRDDTLTLVDDRIEKAIRENNAKLMVIDPLQAFLGANVDMNRANEVRPIFRKLADIAQSTGCAIVMIGHLNKASGAQSTYRGLGSIDIDAVVRSILFVGKVKDDPTTRVIVHEKSSLTPPGQALAFSLGDQKGFRWIGAYDISAEDLLAGGEGTKAELKQEQAMKLIYEFLSDGREASVAEINKEAIHYAKINAKQNHMKNMQFVDMDATAFMMEAKRYHHPYDVIILDPPRAGTTQQFIYASTSLAPQKILYISCDPRTLVRDLKQFRRAGYVTDRLDLVDMFPRTEHIESICLLTRSKRK